MSTENWIAATSREELRNWLLVNSTIEPFCWVEATMKPVPGTLLYLDAVEEALCFGWIDGVKKMNAEAKLVQRLSPAASGAHGLSLIKSVSAAWRSWA